MPDPERLYWDACVFLNGINGVAQYLPHITAIMDAAQKGDLQIITSALSIVEVAFAAEEQKGNALNPNELARIEQFWEPGSPVALVEFTELIAREARNLMRGALPEGWSLKPMDAIHLATARQMQADRFHTYDPALKKYGDIIGIPVDEPNADAPMLPLDAAPPEAPEPPSG